MAVGMKKAKEKIYIFNIKDGDRGDDTEAFIRNALKYDKILQWAYVLHDKEVYNQHDMNSRLYGAQYCWADGFQGQEKYASVQEYIDEQMKMPPFIGDKMDSRWYIFLITDKNVIDEDISDRFGMPNKYYMRSLTDPSSIKDALQSLVNEDNTAVAFERYHYPDDAVRSNFDFREYMEGIVISRAARKRFRLPLIFGRGSSH